MKKIFLLTVSLLFAFTTIYAERVSQEDAALVANHFMSATVQTGVKKASGSKMVLKKAASAEENQYYVYENASGEGWVMVAANDAVTPILAYSKTGTFRTDNMPSNVRTWLGKYDKFIKKVEADGVVATEEAKAEWNHLRKSPPNTAAGNVVVSPLVQTQWDQDEPYNLYAPGTGTSGPSSDKAYTGCVATAMAQVMYFWQWPVQGNGTHSYQPVMDTWDEYGNYTGQIIVYENTTLTAKFGETTYDWANMKKKHYTSDTQAQKQAIGTLMFHCGVGVDMQYGGYEYDGSGAITVNYQDDDEACAQNALWKYFRYKKDGLVSYKRDGYKYGGRTYYTAWTDDDWTAMVKGELDKKHPIMYDGSGSGGHSFICDGYDDQDYFHFNWGWSGSNDGWYKLSNLVPGSGGAGGGGYTFTQDQGVIIGIVPDKPAQPDRNVTWMSNGSEFTKTVASAGVISLPTSEPSACSNGKVFVGWTATANYENATTAPTFVKAGDVIEADATYYAVFATKTTSGGTGTETLEASYSSHDGWTTSGTGTGGSGSSAYWVLKSGASITSPTISDLSSVTKVEFQVRTYGGANYKTVNVTTSGGANVGSASASNTTLTNKTINVSGLSGSGSLVFSSSTTSAANGPGINNIKITRSAATVTYSDYSTSCGAVEPCVLTGITLNTDNVKKTFNVGEAFSSAGLVVTAAYSNCSNKTVTPASVSTPDMTSAGTKTVTVSYTENAVTKTATYDITVNAVPVTKYTVKWHSCAGVAEEQYEEGAALKFPTNPGANGSKTFKGWITTEHYTGATAPSYISAGGAVNANADYYAVYGD